MAYYTFSGPPGSKCDNEMTIRVAVRYVLPMLFHEIEVKYGENEYFHLCGGNGFPDLLHALLQFVSHVFMNKIYCYSSLTSSIATA